MLIFFTWGTGKEETYKSNKHSLKKNLVHYISVPNSPTSQAAEHHYFGKHLNICQQQAARR